MLYSVRKISIQVFTMNGWVHSGEQYEEVCRRTSYGSVNLIPIGSALYRGTSYETYIFISAIN